MFVVDTPVSKKNHDASPKHQGNLKRFLRDLHRANEREQTAAESAKREVARLNALVGPSSPSSSSSAGPYKQTPAPAPRAAHEDERKRQLKELEALGVALPDEARRELAMVGDWEETGRAKGAGAGARKMTEKEMVQVELAKQQKRKFEEEEKERKWNTMDEDERAMRGFSIQTKVYPGQGEAAAGQFDPGMLFKGKKDKEKVPEVVKKEDDEQVKVEEEDAPAREDDDVGATPVKKEQDDTVGINVKPEEGVEVEVKKEDSEAAAVGDGVIFKKRKVKNIRKR